MSEVLYLGTQRNSEDRTVLKADHLTTHAVCLGMTGSGKTGLGIVALEELARQGVPLLVIDLKGDLVNLLLGFPELRGADFEPWLPPDDRAEGDSMATAEKTAAFWRQGLEKSGLTGADIAAVRNGVRWQLVTPGVSSASPLDILPSLSAPAGWNPNADPDGARQRVGGLTSALLSLVDRGGDPLSDPDHVLMSSIILEHWSRGDRLDLPKLLSSLVDPPLDRLGALPLDTFYPRDRRMKLVLALNALIASPSFTAWTEGIPMTMDNLLGTDSAPRATIVTLAHLDDKQRSFCLALLTSELVAWMRTRPASNGLSALLYIDEVQGILPPHPAQPPTKGPLLTLLKQGRAFGVGVWLSTQNPVDLDYKALGNAGVKLIGRLITERDRERALEGLGISRTSDGTNIDDLVTSLDKREFVLSNVRDKQRVRTFSSRWAMSYLRGPITLSEIEPLLQEYTPRVDDGAKPTEAVSPAPTQAARSATAPTGTATPPVLGADIEQIFAYGQGRLFPSLVVSNRVTIERKTLSLLRTFEEHWLIPIDKDGAILWLNAEAVAARPDADEQPSVDASFPDAAPEKLARELRTSDRSFVRWRARNHVPVLANTKLKIAADPGEDRDAFVTRCQHLADRADDTQQEKVRARFEKKIETCRNRLEREQDELDRDREQASSRRNEERLGMVEGLFSVLLGSRSLRSAAGKATSKVRASASKRRMRQRAEASVVESEREIDRLEDQLEDLAAEMQDEIDRIAAESLAKAEAVEEVAVRPKQADVVISTVALLWS